ncbi:MAG: DUF4340 domain-containing protein [Clostridiaceae bacterium]|nr:DUF4340 domain-containing protein [Clostridiaceae bacterium]
MLLVIVVILLLPEKPTVLSEQSFLISHEEMPIYVEYSFSDGSQFKIERIGSSSSDMELSLAKVDDSIDPDWTNQNQLATLFAIPTSLTPMMTITDVTDFEQYGLNQPLALIDIAYTSDSHVTIIVGGKSNMGDLQYLQIAGKDEVYAVGSSDLALLYLEERSLISNTFLSADYSTIESVSFQRRSDNFAVTMEAIHSVDSNGVLQDSWQIIEPLSFAPGSLSMNILQFLMYSSVESYLPIDTDLSSIGLINPEFSINVIKSSGDSRTFYLSKRPEGGYFGRTDDFVFPFTISSSSLDNLDSDPVNFFSPYLFQMKPPDISQLDFYSDSFKYRLDIDILDSETIESDRASASLNYVSLKALTEDGRYKFDILFNALSSIRISGYNPSSIPNSEISTYLTFTLRDRSQVNYSFSAKNDREMYLFINDNFSGITINTGTLLASDSAYQPENSLEGAMKYVLGST